MPGLPPSSIPNPAGTLEELAQLAGEAAVVVGPDLDPRWVGSAVLERLDIGGSKDFVSWWRSAVLEPLQVAVEREEPVPDGSPHIVELDGDVGVVVELRTLDDSPESGYLAVVRDPEEHDGRAQAVKLASQMQRLARTQPRVAHELRAPLNSLVLVQELLGHSIADERDERGDSPALRRAAECLENLNGQLRRFLPRLENVLESLLGWAEDRDAEIVDLADLLQEVIALSQPLAREASVQVAVGEGELETGRHGVKGWRLPLETAIFNVLQNALDVTPEGEAVSLELTEATGEDGASRVCIRVRDRGAGVPEAIRDRIWEPFFTTRQGSAGIGLGVAREIAQRHGGTLTLAESTDAGTTFEFELPLHREVTRENPGKPESDRT